MIHLERLWAENFTTAEGKALHEKTHSGQGESRPGVHITRGLPVWSDAIRLAEGCEDFIIAAKDRITWLKRDQIDRGSLSVSNNIAEGFERGTTNERLAFLYIARGSAG